MQNRTKTTRLILVGGFLGAGKTTLLWESARRVMERGYKTGLVTNDQAPELVDTVFLSQNSLEVTEVSGSCFCCNFDGLIDALKNVKSKAEADVIIAEPVGSCTDLSATILQPLKDNMKSELLISPLSVMADPLRLQDILDGRNAGLHPSAAYIFRKQLEESDLILINKSDLLSQDELSRLKKQIGINFPGSEVRVISAKTGEGIDVWLDEMMQRTDAGKRLIEIDYDVYAEGEAVLGWLNSTIALTGDSVDWDKFSKEFLKQLSQKFDRIEAAVGHVKLLVKTKKDYIIANLTGKAETMNFRGSAGVSDRAKLTLNARVEMSPYLLEQIVREALDAHRGLTKKVIAWKCLSPGRPRPTFRYDKVISNFGF